MTYVVETFGLSKDYGRERVVDNLNLSIEEGEIFGLLGPNGAGKTTTLLMLLGLSEPSAGSSRVLGLDPLKHPLEVKSGVGYMAENMGVYADLTARENLRFLAELNRIETPAIDECLELVGLAAAADKKAGTYSRGMRQRLGLAEVLIKNPKLAFLDEPTLGLDPDGIATMLELIERLPREKGLTIVLSSHLLHLVSRVAGRVAILNRGQLLAMGGLAELAAEAGVPEDLEKVYRHYLRSEAGQEVGSEAGLETGPDGGLPEGSTGGLEAVPGPGLEGPGLDGEGRA
ncbi:MAG: ABC transporter ATP-binding protein [Deltaproteobacteria bacterium]|jgi:ABC-2 type transport system ATP-binding protein|nr:ABC transporter ATP-binding protein [Deltaproteobacteria bacterium]